MKIKEYNLLTFCELCICLSFFACQNDNTDTLISSFVGTTVSIPYNELIQIESAYDTLNDNSPCKIIVYMDSTECLSCSLGRFAENEYILHNDERFSDVAIEYIVQIPKGMIDKVRKNFYRNKLCGRMYFDNTDVMKKTKPLVDDHAILHTFVLNNENKVIMVGDPFINDRMTTLLSKVIVANRTEKSEYK